MLCGCDQPSQITSSQPKTLTVALAGNPNSGKTTLFNALTGLRQKVANYPGVTVEKKTGRCRLGGKLASGRWINIIDLPGTYSLISRSPDELIAMEVLRGLRPDTPPPDVVIVVVDASNLQRNLYLVSQLIELGRPLVIALNMMDIAQRRGLHVSPTDLEKSLGVPVIPIVGHRRKGIDELKKAIDRAPMQPDIEAHYIWIESIVSKSTTAAPIPSTQTLDYAPKPTLTARVDAILLHKIWGLLIFSLIMGTLFVSIFWLAKPIMDGIQTGINWLGTTLTTKLADGPIKALITDGIFKGVGAVVVFVPQIALLFLFLAILEDSGYLARAAFLMDRLLAKDGLHGKSFIPLLSSFACAIPGILATRTIENRNDRLATILVAPFMSCSARLPVYTLLIGAFFATFSPAARGGIMLSCYALGIIAAVATAFVFRRTFLKGPATSFILELPSYKLPQISQIARQMWTNTKAFITKAGTTIFCLSVILWAMTYYPRLPKDRADAIAAR